MNNTLKTLAIALAMGLSVSGAFAAATASDTAANYAASWGTTPPNLGSGFGAWNNNAINNNSPPYSGTYLDLTSYGNPDAVLSGGYAWGTYANSGPPTPAFVMSRSFLAGASGSTSLFNQTFSVGISSSGIGGTGSGLSVNLGTAFTLSYLGGGTDNMLLSVGGGSATALPVNYSNLSGGLLVALSVSGPLNSATEGYTLTLSPFAGGPAFYSGSGTFDSSVYNTSSFTFTDTDTSNNQYVNNLNISPEAVPEPSTVAMSLSGLATLLAFRRRAK
jgi:hypothetical protein